MLKLVEAIENLLRPKGRDGFVGIWSDEHKLVDAARETKSMGVSKVEAISPFPLHGIDEALGIPRSFIPYITLAFGLTGCLLGIWFTWWTSAVDWPINVGGKPMWSLPAFIPIIFELTILFSALSSVGSLFVIIGLPQVDPPVIDADLTSHKFALFVYAEDSKYDESKLEELFKSHGAEEVRKAVF